MSYEIQLTIDLMKDDGRLNLVNLASHHKTRLGDETQGWKHSKNNQGEKSFSKDYTSKMSFLCWFIIHNLVFWIPSLTPYVRNKYIMITFVSSITEIWLIFAKVTFSKSNNFQGQKHFWTKCVQMGYKK